MYKVFVVDYTLSAAGITRLRNSLVAEVISLEWARYIAADEANLLSQLPARNGLGQPLSIPRLIPTAEATSYDAFLSSIHDDSPFPQVVVIGKPLTPLPPSQPPREDDDPNKRKLARPGDI